MHNARSDRQQKVSRGFTTTSPALWITVKEVIYGFALAITIGFSLGVLVGETVFGERTVMPYVVAIETMPKVAFAPLFVAWLGFGIESKVALAAFIATFPIVVGTAAGLHAADENHSLHRRHFRTNLVNDRYVENHPRNAADPITPPPRTVPPKPM